MNRDIRETFITAQEIRERIKVLGKLISENYKDKDLVLVSILKGSFIFAADLIRSINNVSAIDFMVVSSYGAGVDTSGKVEIIKDLTYPIKDRHVLIVDDIIDSGTTLHYLKDFLKSRDPASIEIAVLLDKPTRRKEKIEADYVGFVVPNEFVVGYGLDYNEKYRELPYIGVLKPEAYN